MKTLFLCDFDGTVTKSDFYHIVIDHWIGEPGRKYMEDYKKKQPLDYHFLNQIFQMKPMEEATYLDLVKKIEIDSHFITFLEYLKEKKIDFALVSAGCQPYIKDALALIDVYDMHIITNDSKKNGGTLTITPDLNRPFYAEPFGIDKASVVRHFRKEYDTIIFAGDSLPDLGAAKEADLVFATGPLQSILYEHNIEFVPFSNFLQIINHFKSEVSKL